MRGRGAESFSEWNIDGAGVGRANRRADDHGAGTGRRDADRRQSRVAQLGGRVRIGQQTSDRLYAVGGVSRLQRTVLPGNADGRVHNTGRLVFRDIAGRYDAAISLD